MEENSPEGGAEQQRPHQTSSAVRQTLSFSAKKLMRKMKASLESKPDN